METLAVPPAADEAFLRRLDRHKGELPTSERAGPVHSEWGSMAGVAVCISLFVGVLWIAGAVSPDPYKVSNEVSASPQTETQSQVDQHVGTKLEPLYVFYPGLKIVATRLERVLPYELFPKDRPVARPQTLAPYSFNPVPALPLYRHGFVPDSLGPEPLAPETL